MMKQLSVFGTSIPVALLLLVSSIATAEQRRDGSYFCNEEIVAGLSYNANSNKWQSTTFSPKGKFILRLKFVQSRTEIFGNIAGHRGIPIDVDDYNAAITEAGENLSAACDTNRGQKKTVGLRDGLLIC